MQITVVRLVNIEILIQSGSNSKNVCYKFSVFGLDSPLLFPPGMDPAKIYNPLMEMSDPRGMHPDHHGPFLKKKSK